MKLRYIGPILDKSGYAEACRNYILALHKLGVELTISPIKFENDTTNVVSKENAVVFNTLIDKQLDYDTVLIQLTPDLWPRFIEKGKKNIGYVAWETTEVHPEWVSCCNLMDAVLVPCEMNVSALKKSGVTTKIYKVPHGIDVNSFNKAKRPFAIHGIPEDHFKFYSIFQWNARKNPEGLLRAYFNAFVGVDDVALIIKSYMTGNVINDSHTIKDQIRAVKMDMGFLGLPKVYLISSFLSEEGILGLHLYGDCNVSLHCGEGWGLVPFAAGLAGNPVIATGFGGNMEYMNEENSFVVPYQETYVAGMSSFNRWYLGSQTWASPDLVKASEYMRYAYNHRKDGAIIGNKLRENIRQNFSWESVGKVMLDCLLEV
jgi:glycosyltransferase involved in cell wall biosynthesis